MVNITFFTGDLVMDISIFLFFLVFLMIFVQGFVIIRSFLKKSFNTNLADSSSQKLAHCTLIVPVYNEQDRLVRCIKEIIASDYPKDLLEVLIVDDGSIDRTAIIAKRFEKKYSYIKLVQANHEGKSAALNYGIKKANHEIILTLDVDVDIPKDFISKLIAPFSDESVGATNGMALIKKDSKGILSAFQKVEFRYNNLIRSSFSKLFSNGIWFFGAASAYRKSALKKAGMFRTDRLTEDMDISLSIFRSKYKVITVTDAFYYTEACTTLKTLFLQRMRWFFGGLQSTWANKDLSKKNSFAIRYLFVNQWFWSFFSFLAIPIIIYQVNFWMPIGFTESFWYLFRWFSLSGSVYVLYMLPIWGLNFVSIFGVLAGVFTAFLLLLTYKRNNVSISFSDLFVIFFYFPYTLLLNVTFLLGFFWYFFSKKRGFIR